MNLYMACNWKRLQLMKGIVSRTWTQGPLNSNQLVVLERNEQDSNLENGQQKSQNRQHQPNDRMYTQDSNPEAS